MLNGLPYPRCPTGGNLADCTNFLASSAVYSKGTTIPCAPESSARFTIQAWLSGMRTMGLTPQDAIAATDSCIWASAWANEIGRLGLVA